MWFPVKPLRSISLYLWHKQHFSYMILQGSSVPILCCYSYKYLSVREEKEAGGGQKMTLRQSTQLRNLRGNTKAPLAMI